MQGLHVIKMTECEICSAPVEAKEYDHDEDMYYMICDNGHRYWATNDDETWK